MTAHDKNCLLDHWHLIASFAKLGIEEVHTASDNATTAPAVRWWEAGH